MKEFEHDPDFEGFILRMKSGAKFPMCIHKSKKQLFADKAGFVALPMKTDEWLSAIDLAKDEDFPNTTFVKITNALNKFEHDPEFEGFIRDMKSSNGHAIKCLHISKKQLFAERAGFKQKRVTQQALQDGTKVVGAMSAVQDIENSTKPDDQHKM